MSPISVYAVLFLAAMMEAGGDALIRLALHEHQMFARVLLFLFGAIVLFGYGVVVNSPPWDFGRLLGVYVSLFFVVAQIMNFALFGVKPGLPILVGGSLIFVGGLVMTFWRS